MVLGLGATTTGAEAAADDRAPLIKVEQRPIDGQYIVMLETGMSPAKVAAAASRARSEGAEIRHVYSTIDGYSAALTQSELDYVRRDPAVAYVEQDHVMRTADTQTNATWGLDRIDQRDLPLSGAYTSAATGLGVKAYIIDTGLNTAHDEFAGRVAPGYTAIGDGRGVDDCNGHGTHVAGTVAGTTFGVAKEATVIPVRVLDCQGSGFSSGVIAGMDWVAGQSAASPRVANVSLGGEASVATDDAVTRMVDAGVTVAVAAGNENQNACNVSPARAASAITVASSTMTDSRSSFSNWGSCVDLFAPGSSITSAWINSTAATNTVSGTSTASPHVAGAAALYLQDNPTASPATVARALVDNASSDKISDPMGSPNRLLFTNPSVPTTPSAPTGVSAVGGDQLAMVSWPAAAANGSPVTSYTVTSSGGQTLTVPGDTTVATATGLTNGASYTFTVVARNDVGTSPASTPSNTVTPSAGPTAPTVEPADTAAPVLAEFDFSPKSVDVADGSKIVTLTARVTDATGAEAPTMILDSDSTTETAGFGDMALVSGALTDGVWQRTVTIPATAAPGAWTVTVYPLNDTLGNNETRFHEHPTKLTVFNDLVAPDATAPEAPTQVQANRGDASATVSWTAPADNGSSPIVSYTVTASPGGSTVTVPGDTTDATVVGLTNGTAYTFTVAATNAAGTSPGSVPSTAVTPARRPGRISKPTVKVDTRKAIITWTTPGDGGSPLTGYRVRVNGKARTTGPGVHRLVLKRLKPGRHQVTVAADNAVGVGPASDIVKFRIRIR